MWAAIAGSISAGITVSTSDSSTGKTLFLSVTCFIMGALVNRGLAAIPSARRNKANDD
jgi:hypothetical protein